LLSVRAPAPRSACFLRPRRCRHLHSFPTRRSSDLARINLSRFVVTGCAAKTSATVTFPSLNLISLFAFCFNIWLKQNAKREMRRSEERLSRNAETDLVCRLLLEKRNRDDADTAGEP